VTVPDVGSAAVPLARVLRGDLVESVHLGHVVVLAPDGSVPFALGDPDVTIWARSSLKPLQAVAMLREGLDVDRALLALVCASHNGEGGHLAVVRTLLSLAGLGSDDLGNTPDWPLDPDAAWQWRADGHGTEPLTQNCSGKHAGMLATCAVNGWSTHDYLSPGHPLQLAVRSTVADLTGVPVAHETVDGCGAPLFSTTLTGLARAFGAIARAPMDAAQPVVPSPAVWSALGAEARVALAMTNHPQIVGGPGRDVTRVMTAVPGLVAKDGADGVYAAGLPDGGAIAFKVLDGAERPRPALLVAALAVAGFDTEDLRELGRTPVLGHGRPVGSVTVAFADEP